MIFTKIREDSALKIEEKEKSSYFNVPGSKPVLPVVQSISQYDIISFLTSYILPGCNSALRIDQVKMIVGNFSLFIF